MYYKRFKVPGSEQSITNLQGTIGGHRRGLGWRFPSFSEVWYVQKLRKPIAAIRKYDFVWAYNSV